MFKNYTVAKIVAYILVAFAIFMLILFAFEKKTKELFDVDVDVKKMCQPNLASPCHYREVRGENVSTGDQACHYAWNAPALFDNKVTLNNRDQLQFCDSVDTGIDGNLKTENCSETLESVWSSFKKTINESNAKLSQQVTDNSASVDDSKRTLTSTTTAMNNASDKLKDSTSIATNSTAIISDIEMELNRQKTCDTELLQTKQSLKDTRNELKKKQNEVDELQKEIVEYEAARPTLHPVPSWTVCSNDKTRDHDFHLHLTKSAWNIKDFNPKTFKISKHIDTKFCTENISDVNNNNMPRATPPQMLLVGGAAGYWMTIPSSSKPTDEKFSDYATSLPSSSKQSIVASVFHNTFAH